MSDAASTWVVIEEPMGVSVGTVAAACLSCSPSSRGRARWILLAT